MDSKQNVHSEIKHYEVHDLQLEISYNEGKHIQQNLQQSQDNMGQVESKKLSKKLHSTQMQTKGTTMSFGFRKNLTTTPMKLKKLIKTNTKYTSQLISKKKQTDTGLETGDNSSEINAPKKSEPFAVQATKLNENSESPKDKPAKVKSISQAAEQPANTDNQLYSKTVLSDDKACFGLLSQEQANKQKKTSTKCSLHEAAGKNSKSSKYSSRSNSHSISSKAGNQSTGKSNLKYRSNSAHVGMVVSPNSRDANALNAQKAIAFNLKGSNASENSQNPGQRLQSTKRTTNPPSSSYVKFTLHTVNLPKAQYPVPISISISTPTGKANRLPTFIEKTREGFKNTTAGQRNFSLPMSNALVQQHRFDAKTVKHIANTSTVRMLQDNREITTKSGHAGLDAGLEKSNKQRGSRFNHLNDEHKVGDVCNSDDIQSGQCATVESLTLPKLPSNNKITPLPLNGLVRSNTASSQEKQKLTGTTADTESITVSKAVCKEENEIAQKLKSGALMPFTSPASTPNELKLQTEETEQTPAEGINAVRNVTNLLKFDKMALEGSKCLLEDETSLTDSLLSSSEFEFDSWKQRKQKLNKEYQDKNDLATELDNSSPLQRTTPPFNQSSSLSLSDCDNLIDDEIADQPALLCNQQSQKCVGEDLLSYAQYARATDSMEFNMFTPLSLCRGRMQRGNSLDSTSPCESICSDDLIMDFDMVSSMDSIDLKGRCAADLKSLSEKKIFKKEQANCFDKDFLSNSKTKTKDNGNNYNLQLPKHAISLLNRSRLQLEQENQHQLKASDDYSNTFDQILSPASSLNNFCSLALKRQPKPFNCFNYQQQQKRQRRFNQSEMHSACSEEFMLYDKSFRNAMIRDVLQFKKQLIHLRHILQEFDILNPFDNGSGDGYEICDFNDNACNDADVEGLTANNTDYQQLADIRRQIVYLQGEVDDRDRTIRLQQDVIKQLKSNKDPKPQELHTTDASKERVNTATQTERLHQLSTGIESLNRLQFVGERKK